MNACLCVSGFTHPKMVMSWVVRVQHQLLDVGESPSNGNQWRTRCGSEWMGPWRIHPLPPCLGGASPCEVETQVTTSIVWIAYRMFVKFCRRISVRDGFTAATCVLLNAVNRLNSDFVFALFHMSFLCSSTHVQQLCILVTVAVTSTFLPFLLFILRLRLSGINSGMFSEWWTGKGSCCCPAKIRTGRLRGWSLVRNHYTNPLAALSCCTVL